MLLLLATLLQDTVTAQLRPFVRVSAPVVALTNVRVIDGTGAPAKAGQTIVISGGAIAEVGDAASVATESFAGGELDHPHYTRPAEWRGRTVPDVLLSGHHGAIETWRQAQRAERMRARRPDLLVREEKGHEGD